MNNSNMYNSQQFQQPPQQQYQQYPQQYVYGSTNPQHPQVRPNVQPVQPQQQVVQPSLQALSVKLYMPENEIRKTSFPRDITYEQVLERSLEFINKDRNQNKVQTNNLRVYYMDEEKEFIRFDSVAEWTEALKPVQSAPNGLLKIRVQIKDKKKKEDKKPVTIPVKKEEPVPQFEAPKPTTNPFQPQPSPFIAPQPQLAPFGVQQQVQQAPVLFGGVQPTQPTQSPPQTFQNSPFTSPQGTPQPQEKIGGDVHNSLRASFHNLLQQNPQKSNAPYATPTSQPVFPAPQYSPQMPTTGTQPRQSLNNSPFQQQVQQQPTVNPTTSQPAPVFGSPQAQTAHPHEPLLRELNDMGFTNREKNIELLTKHNGHLLNVINALMEQ